MIHTARISYPNNHPPTGPTVTRVTANAGRGLSSGHVPFAALLVGCIVSALSIPLVFANGGPATSPYACGRLGVILDTIRTLESGGDYTARASGASAAGAYQYITSTWRH